MKKLLAGLLLIVLAPMVSANEGLYAGVNLVNVEYKESGFQSVHPLALSFRFGKEFTRNFAIEGRLGTGVSDDTIRISGVDVAVEVDNFYGVYARGIIPLNRVSLYGLVGYTHGEIKASAGGVAASADDGDFSYGVGADIAVWKGGAINVEYGRLFSGTGYEVNALSAGVRFNF